MQSTHTKVEFNGEFRRFTLQTLSFEHLEKLLRQLLPIQEGVSINVLFLDDENDWILVSSDEELVYATSIAGSPLRLSVRLCTNPSTPAKEIRLEETEETKETEVRSASPFEERKAKKISFITARIEILEEKLAQDLPAGKATALQAKLVVLRDKLVRLNSEEPANFKHEGQACGNRRGRGRGCRSHQFANRGDNEDQTKCGRGGGRGRGRWAKQHQETSENPEDQILFGRIQELKTELRAARQANDKAQIEAKWQALQQLKAQRKALREERNPRQPGWEAFRNLKEEKRNCMLNLKEAKSTQNQEKIESCQLALKKAQEDLRNAKLEFCNAKC